MSTVYIHPATRTRLQAVESALPHAMLLSGPYGVGLRTVAWYVAQRVTDKAYVSEVLPDEKGTITIDTVRSLYRQTRAKHQRRRVVIIDDVDTMSQPAQNAFLKLLEEPAQDVTFILTSHQPTILLPTILSRLQNIGVNPVPADVTLQVISEITSDTKLVAQLRFMADGLPAELRRLLDDEAYRREHTELAEKAKQFITSSRGEKLMLVNRLSGSRDTAQNLVGLLLRMLQMQLDKRQDEGVLDYMDTLISIQNNLENNGHVRTQLLRAVL